jgi:hypothetical protein
MAVRKTAKPIRRDKPMAGSPASSGRYFTPVKSAEHYLTQIFINPRRHVRAALFLPLHDNKGWNAAKCLLKFEIARRQIVAYQIAARWVRLSEIAELQAQS